MTKKITFIVLTLILVFGCNQAEKYEKELEIAFEKKIESELNSGIRNDTIFLGYTLGMNKKEFSKKTNELRKEKKLYVNNESTLAYKMTIDDNAFGKDLEATFSPEYYNEKLFKLGVSVKPTKYSSPELTQLQLVRLFNDKYGLYDHFEKSILETTNNYYWIDGNRQIEVVCGFNDARIFYTDLLAEKESDTNKELEQEKELNKTKSDL